jgi:hypothetical protein
MAETSSLRNEEGNALGGRVVGGYSCGCGGLGFGHSLLDLAVAVWAAIDHGPTTERASRSSRSDQSQSQQTESKSIHRC